MARRRPTSVERPTKPMVKTTRLVTLACQRLFDQSATNCWKPTKFSRGTVLESLKARRPDQPTKA